ncbi:hypothetical protein C2G38_2181120 [Gigaspora rosea]|uniref:Zn(2)-C6 fungal-type domain-containing protein n=1 Tax=Gigaspora rosea TaxID=44941 RepID=A0A397VEF2_9GLOM|nr:hypothetical protein C2G38_2181120 [Gigaspora rosea]CAG8445175.1 4854_t:CDS:1 [Gigaspora rosea]
MIQNPNFKKDPDNKKPMPDKKKKNTVSCDVCKGRKVKCVYEGEGPCKRCMNLKCESECIFGERKKRGPRTTDMPSMTEFQKWGKMLWDLLRDRQAIADHFQKLNSNFGQLNGNFNGGSDLTQENLPDGNLVENSSNREQEILSTLGENILNGDLDRSHNVPTPSTNFGDNTLTIIDKPTVDGDSAGEARSRTINRQQPRLSRSPSRDNRQTRQVTRNREPISRPPSPNHMVSAYSDGSQPNPTLRIETHLQIPIIESVYHSPNHTEYPFPLNDNSISNNLSPSSSAHIPSPYNIFEELSNQSDIEDPYATSFQSTPLILSDFEDVNLTTTSFQSTPLVLSDFEDVNLATSDSTTSL